MKICLYINGRLHDSTEVLNIDNLQQRKWAIADAARELRDRNMEQLQDMLVEWHIVVEIESKMNQTELLEL